MAISHHLLLSTLVLMTLSFSANVYGDYGTATFNKPPYVPSSCYGFEDQGVMIGAASDDIWDDGAACGRFYSVQCLSGTNQGDPEPCTGDSIVVKITDQCPPPGCQGTIDLSEEAFAAISNTDAGKINILYQQA